MNDTGNKNRKATAVGKLVAGAQKRFPNGKQSVTLEGETTTIDDVTKELQSFVDNRDAVVAAQATARSKLAVERAQMPALNALIVAFIAFVRLTFGDDSEALADFGLAPRKARTPLTAEQKAVAAAKRRATRGARGTTGPKARKAVHGNVTAKLVVTPAPAAEAEATAPLPAPAAAPPAPNGATATQPKG